MGHWPTHVIFAVEESRGVSNGALGDDFGDEDDASANFVTFATPDVETEIDFFEFGVEGNRNGSQEFCAAETEPDEANVCFSVEGIEFCAGRDVFLHAGGIRFVVEHHKVAPLGGEKYFFGARHRRFVKRRAFCRGVL